MRIWLESIAKPGASLCLKKCSQNVTKSHNRSAKKIMYSKYMRQATNAGVPCLEVEYKLLRTWFGTEYCSLTPWFPLVAGCLWEGCGVESLWTDARLPTTPSPMAFLRIQSGGTGKPKLPVAEPRRGLTVGSKGGNPPKGLFRHKARDHSIYTYCSDHKDWIPLNLLIGWCQANFPFMYTRQYVSFLRTFITSSHSNMTSIPKWCSWIDDLLEPLAPYNVYRSRKFKDFLRIYRFLRLFLSYVSFFSNKICFLGLG